MEVCLEKTQNIVQRNKTQNTGAVMSFMMGSRDLQLRPRGGDERRRVGVQVGWEGMDLILKTPKHKPDC